MFARIASHALENVHSVVVCVPRRTIITLWKLELFIYAGTYNFITYLARAILIYNHSQEHLCDKLCEAPGVCDVSPTALSPQTGGHKTRKVRSRFTT